VKIGPTPPIKTKEGWLEIIHGVTSHCSGQRYSIGAILLDLHDPTIVIGKTSTPLLVPDRDYEYQGIVPNVVFTTGAIADHDQDRLRVYYGAADTCICLATGSISDIINRCKKEI
jgi:beta-1,4-mannooligosaccharide/beta-1,4-mannosyl-N-acetylglucosamine phosphorylase